MSFQRVYLIARRKDYAIYILYFTSDLKYKSFKKI